MYSAHLGLSQYIYNIINSRDGLDGMIFISIWYAVVRQNLLMLATGELRQLVDESSCRDVIHLTAEDGKTLVDVVTDCHDDERDVITRDTSSPPSSSSPHHNHHHQQQQQQQQQQQCCSGVITSCSNTSAPNFSPELFLNTCDENMTSLSLLLSSSSSSSFSSPAVVPSTFAVALSCTSVPS